MYHFWEVSVMFPLNTQDLLYSGVNKAGINPDIRGITALLCFRNWSSHINFESKAQKQEDI